MAPRRRRLVLVAAWGGAGLLLAVTVMMVFFPNPLTPATQWERLLVAAVALLGAAFLLAVDQLTVRTVRLEVDSAGIDCVTLGLRVRSGWDNCVGVGYSAYGAIVGRGLLLREPSVTGGRFSKWFARLNGQDRFIPLACFVDGEHGELLRWIRVHAPHVVVDSTSEGSTPSTPTDRTPRSWRRRPSR